jgi:hypothetical protein
MMALPCGLMGKSLGWLIVDLLFSCSSLVGAKPL